jgi:hypothetical protein
VSKHKTSTTSTPKEQMQKQDTHKSFNNMNKQAQMGIK